jgi:hypothetical protein
VIPALVEGAAMPSAHSLPKSIADLADRNAISLSTSQFSRDAQTLGDIIARRLQTQRATPDKDAERKRIATIMRTDIGTLRKSLLGRRALIGSLGALSAALAGALAKISYENPPIRNHPSVGPYEPDTSKFAVDPESEERAYAQLAVSGLKPLKIPHPKGYPNEPILTLSQMLDLPPGKALANTGHTVFHSVGCTGNRVTPGPMEFVAGAMTREQRDSAEEEKPAFLFHLGDVIYSFGQMQYHFDQFYVPFRHYHAPILAIAGNHDGVIQPGSSTPSLRPFLENFCADGFQPALAAAGELQRTPQIQPGVYFTFEAPSLRILALYSNVLEGPGVIASDEIGHDQLDYLDKALLRIKQQRYGGALIIAHHHPAYTGGSQHGWSVEMREMIDQVCQKHDVWPHAVLSAHAHNYQRLTRTVGSMQIPYVIAGCGGHGTPARLSHGDTALKTPFAVTQDVTLESYDDRNYGYLRIMADQARLTIEFRRPPSSLGETQPKLQEQPQKPDGAPRSPTAAVVADVVAIDLATRKLVHA